jgi:lysine 6-dehydrogenase
MAIENNIGKENNKLDQKHILIMGYGMQGKAALYDLVQSKAAAEYTVIDESTAVESVNESYPGVSVRGLKVNINDLKSLTETLKGVDIIIEALPSGMALSMGRFAAEMGISLVSSNYYLSQAIEDPKKIAEIKKEINSIDQIAKKNGCTILSEFGLDPGLDLILGKHALSELDKVDEFFSYGAGIPVQEACTNPLNYKFSWSVNGLIQAYKRPSSLISKGKTHQIKDADMFSPENMHIIRPEGIDSELECYPNGNSAYYAERFGLSDTIKEMGRYTGRYPGHCTFWDTFVKCGFLNKNPIKVGDAHVSPMELTIALLGSDSRFFYEPNEQDIAYIRVEVCGHINNEKKRIIYEILDRRDLVTGFTAMQRTVGFTMSIGAQLILNGVLDNLGLVTPLMVPLAMVQGELKQRGIEIIRKVDSFNESEI